MLLFDSTHMTIQSREISLPEKRWIEPEVHTIANDFQQAIGGIPLISQMLHRLGHNDISSALGFLDINYYHPASPLELTDLEKAIEYLITAINQKKKITVWGDFDVDGQTATTLLVSSLQQLGAVADYHIPVRASESHGINLPVLKEKVNQGTQVLLTCDTGITANAEVAYAQNLGLPVIITDHHDLPMELPQALAIINPKRLPLEHPLGSLPGVGVAYELVYQLCCLFDRPEISQSFLDLVALGIVADLALIKGDTRFLLQKGLDDLKNTPRVGLQLLYEMMEINPQSISEEHISFYLAPRLNALGRLSDANRIVEFLTTNDLGKARLMAVELEGLNAQRKLMTDQVFNAAQAQLEADPRQLDEGVILLHNQAWPAGVIGIVASRLVERYNLPTILLSSPPGQYARGSARSIEGINITQAIADNQHLLIGFGGHPMAAGLSIEPEKIPDFHQSLANTIQNTAGTDKLIATIQIDAYLPLSDLSLDLVTQIERLAPFGPGNPAPLLASRRLKLSGYTSVGRNAEHLLLTVEDETGFQRKVIWWQSSGWLVPQGMFDLAYTVRATTYRGQKDVQVEWIDFRTVGEKPIQLESKRQLIQVVDYRQDTNPIPIIEPLLQIDDNQAWCEGTQLPTIPCLNRYMLSSPCQKLVIMTIPPSPAELRTVIEKVSPEEIILLGINPGLDEPQSFLKRLAGLIKYSISTQNGHIKLSELAAASAHRIRTIQAGIAWLEAHGHISILSQNGENLVIQAGLGTSLINALQTAQQLRTLLDETAAYRAYFLKANPEALINL